MTEIKLYIDFHNNTERIFAQFGYNSAINKIIKTVKGATWSQNKKQWHFDVNKETVEILSAKNKKDCRIRYFISKTTTNKTKSDFIS